MVQPNPRPRRGRVLLWVSAALFAAFAALAFSVWYGTRFRFDADPRLLEALVTAEFVEDAPAAEEAGWPQWRGAHRDGVTIASDLATRWPASGPKMLWEKNIADNEGYSSFAVLGGRAYTLLRDGAEEAIVCWNVADGTEVWRKSYASGVPKDDSLGGYGVGPRSTPTLHEGLVYTVGAGGRFQCRNAKTGDLEWEHDLLKEYGAANLRWGTAFSPLVDDDLVFANPGGPGGKSLVAFDRKTGTEKWRSQDDPAGYSSPVAITLDGERQIVFFTGHSVVGVRAKDGSFRWRFPWETQHGVNAATPILFRAKIDGTERQFVFVSSGYGKGCALLVLSPNAGRVDVQRVFESNSLCSHFGSPVRLGDHVYGFNETKLVCLSLRTGKVTWEKNGFKKGSLLAVNGYLLVLAEDGKLALMKATPEEPAIVTETARLMGRRCWTMPVLAEGRLFLRDEDNVRCFYLRQK
jgi:outer membrane protein assembly factor BamB